MPLFSEHIANMYYGSSSPYTGLPYSYSTSSISPIGSSYSASYLNPGGNYSNHSSLSSYSRAPLSSRWITSSGRNYSPMLSTISERGSSSPVRINSPRRIPLPSRTYSAPTYTPRPLNINTADIDVSRDKYRYKPDSPLVSVPVQPKEAPVAESDNGPFMPRVDGKPETGINSSPGSRSSTIKRGRTVVRLYTIKRKERDSPRKPNQDVPTSDAPTDKTSGENINNFEDKEDEKEFIKWREKLSEDLNYKDKRQKKTLGAKLVEKFIVKDNDKDLELPTKLQKLEETGTQSIPTTPAPSTNVMSSSVQDRRCSVEMLAEQANLLDSLIMRENLSTGTLDLTKVGLTESPTNGLERLESIKKRKQIDRQNSLKTTKSDHSLHDSLKSYHRDVRDPKCFNKRRSLKKCSSSSSIRRLDSITEFPKEPINLELPAIDENKLQLKKESVKQKPKPKLKAKITSSVEISPPASPLKFRIDNITVEEKPKLLKKEISYSSEVEQTLLNKEKKIVKKVSPVTKKCTKNVTATDGDSTSPEPEDGNFWDKIGKRETVYLIKRKQNIEESKEKNKRALFWFPEEEDAEFCQAQENIECPGIKNCDIAENSNILQNDRKEIDHSDSGTIKKINDIDIKISSATTKSKEKENESATLKIQKTESETANQMSENKILKKEKKECVSKCKTPSLSESKAIEKSASLDTFEEDKNELDTEKKTKSEKSNNVAHKIDSKPPQPILLTVTEKIKTLSLDKEQCNKTVLRNSIKKNIDSEKINLNPEKQRETNQSEETSEIKKTTDLGESKVVTQVPDETISKEDTSLSIKDTSEIGILYRDIDHNHYSSLPSNTQLLSPQHVPTTTCPKDRVEIAQVELKNVLENNDPIPSTSKQSNQVGQSIEKDSGLKNKASTTDCYEDKLTNISNVVNVKITASEPSKTENPLSNNVLINEISSDCSNTPSSKSEDIIVDIPSAPVEVESQNIPNNVSESESISNEQIEAEIREENKADQSNNTEEPEQSKQDVAVTPAPLATKKPVKEEKATRPLIATPRPLQKKAPQVIHSSDSSDSSSEEESSDEDDEESDNSEESAEFYECENNPDGRTSTGSNDSGFDSSAPTSPATFSQIKKGPDGSGASSSSVPASNNADILEQELEQSTAYDIFRKTGRFTPPAKSIPRFRKYTIEDFQFIKVLGKGSFGKVLLAELRDTEYYYAVKCLKKDVVLEDDDVECTLIERKVLALGTNHPYLCHLFATFQTDSHLFFVMEYLNGGDLMFHIQQSGRFPEARARFYAAEIVSGLKFLHKRGIVYRDLKLDNILLDYEGHVRIADFGMCKLQIYLDKTADTFCGTPDYMAPEIIKGLKYSQTVDWWSFGVLLYEMLIGQSPFSGCDEDELFWSICNEMPSYPRFLSQESLTILTRLLDKDARTRLGGTECMHGDVRDQDFFRAVHWDRLERRDLEAPFRPRVRHPLDTQYFDRAFTGERPRLTAVEPQVLRSMDQEPFRGFSYTNPNTTDR